MECLQFFKGCHQNIYVRTSLFTKTYAYILFLLIQYSVVIQNLIVEILNIHKDSNYLI